MAYSGVAQIDTLEVDCVLTESFQADCDVTEHPVESGSNISDHIRPKPISFTLTGVVSNSPIDEQRARAQRTGGGTGYAQKAADKLVDIRRNAKLITVTTKDRIYPSMAMLSLAFPKDNRTGDALVFTAQFKQIRVVENKTTKKVVAKSPRAQQKTKDGKQNNPETEDARSILKKGSDATGISNWLGSAMGGL